MRAKEYHKKEDALRKLKEKAAFRNPDEFYFKMINTKTVNGVHKLESEANKYTQEKLMLMKTQDIGYVMQKVQTEKKKIEKLTAMLHSLDNQPSNRHVYYAEDRKAAASYKVGIGISVLVQLVIYALICRKAAASYKELQARENRVKDLEKLYMDMALLKKLQKKGRKHKLCEDEIVSPTSKPVYKWRSGQSGEEDSFLLGLRFPY